MPDLSSVSLPHPAPAEDEPRHSSASPGAVVSAPPSAPLDFESFWSRYFAPLHAAALTQEEQFQDEAFAALPHTLCGFEVRGMTAYDLLLLHGCENPFVAGGRITAAHVAQFLAVLVEPAPRGWFARRRFFRRVAALDLRSAAAAIQAYVRRMLASADLPAAVAPPPGESAPAATPVNMCFIAPLVVRIAQGTGGWSESDILGMRLDKLFQYRRAIAAREEGQRTYPAADRLLSDALSAHAHYLATGELPRLGGAVAAKSP